MQTQNPLEVKSDEIGQLSAIKYCLYARKSSEAEEKQALSVDSQVKEMLALAERHKLRIEEIYRESHSAKDCGQRPVFNKLLDDIRLGKFDGILVWHPDRLARNAGDLGAVVDLLDQKKLVEIRTYSQRFTNNPNEKFLLMILGSQAKLENDNKSINVKRGLRARCEMGLWPGPAPTGYIKTKNADDKCRVFIDPKRAPAIKKAFEKIAYEGWSGRKTYMWMRNEMNFRTTSGKYLSLGNFYRLIKLPFYYGEFEYPTNSGNWYKGIHTPVITKDVFQLVQEKLRIEHDFSYGSKEFAFTRLMTCGSCGSGISAQEKIKVQKNGNVHRYTYYACNRRRNINCKEGYLEEKKLISQLVAIIDQIDLDKSGIRSKLENEIERYKKFHAGILGRVEEEYNAADVDIRNYAKYLLIEGTMIEKRDLLSCLKSNLILTQKTIQLI